MKAKGGETNCMCIFEKMHMMMVIERQGPGGWGWEPQSVIGTHLLPLPTSVYDKKKFEKPTTTMSELMDRLSDALNE